MTLPGQHRRRAPPRLADADRRRDRPGPAGRRRRRGRLPGPTGVRAPGRRLGHVHDPVAVDDGPRAARRHRRDLQQPLLRDPERRARARRRPGSGGPKAHAQLDLSRPDLDFVALADGIGVPAVRVDTGEDAGRRARAGRRRARTAPDRGRDPDRLQRAAAAGDAVRAARARGRCPGRSPRPVKRRLYP